MCTCGTHVYMYIIHTCVHIIHTYMCTHVYMYLVENVTYSTLQEAWQMKEISQAVSVIGGLTLTSL